MIQIKTEKEIKTMTEGGQKLRTALETVLAAIKVGVTTKELDEIAEKKIIELGGKPSFKMVPGYHWTTCISINDQVVHGIPSERKISEDDVVGVDIGCYYQGLHTDLSTTVKVSKGKLVKDKFLKVGEEALENAIKEARVGNYLGNISLAIQETVEKAGYSPVGSLTGHGVGRSLHEDPMIPCYLDRKVEKTPVLEAGMTLAIEVIYNEGKPQVVLENDGWTISTEDGKISGLFEETVAITESGFLVLTRGKKGK